MTDTFALSKTTPLQPQDGIGQEAAKSGEMPDVTMNMQQTQENAMWEMVINKHGKKEF